MAKTIEFTATAQIARPVDEVRKQFGDFRYHAQHEVHPGLRFTVFEQTEQECRYQIDVTVLGMAQSDKTTARLQDDGTLFAEVTEGTNKGFAIRFAFDPEGGGTKVVGRVVLPVTGFKALVAPLFKQALIRIVDKALREDKADLESGRYGRYLQSQPGTAPAVAAHA